MIQGLGGDDQIYAQEGNDTLQGGDGNDYLDGGQGDDAYDGGSGNDWMSDFGGGSDTYVWGTDSGQDTVNDWGVPGEIDTVQLTGATPSDLTITRELAVNPNTITLHLNATGDSLQLANWFLSENQIEQIRFVDGTVWDTPTILMRLQSTLTGTENVDWLYGSDLADTVQGLGGNDQLYGQAGHDTLLGGEGDDFLNGGAGNDVYDGGVGNDWMSDFEGGSDTYVWGTGSGQDVMYDYDGIPGNIDRVQVAGATPSEVTITREIGRAHV